MKDAASIFSALLAREQPPFMFWRSPEGEIRIAAGVHALHRPAHPREWRDWLRGGAPAQDSDAAPYFVTLAFDPAARQDSPWEDFAAAQLWMPQMSYHAACTEESFINLSPADFPEQAQERHVSAFPEHGAIEIPAWGEDRYRHRVRAGLERLRAPVMEKIVLARRIEVVLRSNFDPVRAITAMQQPHSFSICYSPDGKHFFLSATPERLGRVREGRFSTMALAGTMTRDRLEKEGHAALLENAKERAEHAYVTEMIHGALSPFTRDLSTDDVQLLALPHITHILTQFEGTLVQGRGMLDVISALHPTPAVAGTPREEAAEAIRELEDFSRGLYAGCVGWMDSAGNGDAAVAIRSAVVEERTAYTYAGAGIVADSDAGDEEKETRAKLQTMLDILGS